MKNLYLRFETRLYYNRNEIFRINNWIIFGVEWLIEKEIEYLNIKPKYILISKENIKLIDYGLKFLNSEIINNYRIMAKIILLFVR